ncbi:hypothetical protein IDVR_16790 [Intrasporangium sp. DVR]
MWLYIGLRSRRAPPVRCGSRGVCPALSSTAHLATADATRADTDEEDQRPQTPATCLLTSEGCRCDAATCRAEIGLVLPVEFEDQHYRQSPMAATVVASVPSLL